MHRQIVTSNSIIGFHCWPEAPEECSYLRARHRHVFEVRCWFDVQHNERDIEINLQAEAIAAFFRRSFGEPCEFGHLSCESIAERVLDAFSACSRCEVLEDGYAGASLSK